jgi:2-oxoisovalerate dehydrogenase E2 component (dihydrolipoyl transacylase)
MAFTLNLPEVGETVTEGTIERWLKQPGEQVAKYEPIVEVNTDKVNVELPCPVSGTLREILAQEGETVAIGAPLCVIEEVAGEVPADIAPPRPKEEPAPAQAAPGRSASGNGTRQPHRATPRVRKLADELGVSLDILAGTGPGGRIVEEDVRAAAERGSAKAGVAVGEMPSTAERPRAPLAAEAEDETIALSAIRKTIAQRMSASASTAPHAWLAMEADVTELVRLRESRKEAFRERHGVDLTYLPFMAHAVAQTLLEHPYLNASWAEDKIILKKRINLGIAVATDRGLMVPVVKDADRLSVAGLAQAMSDIGQRARDNKLTLNDVQGGTFTLDNTGAFGAIISKPIINHGQSAIITFEAITKQPRVVGDSAIAVRSVVMICLSFDHRVMDGHQAGYFLRDVKNRLDALGPEAGID